MRKCLDGSVQRPIGVEECVARDDEIEDLRAELSQTQEQIRFLTEETQFVRHDIHSSQDRCRPLPLPGTMITDLERKESELHVLRVTEESIWQELSAIERTFS